MGIPWHLLLYFQFLHFQKCHIQIFWEMTIGIIPSLLINMMNWAYKRKFDFFFQSLWPNSSSTKSRSILIGWIGRWYYNSNFLHIQLLPCVPFCSIEIYQQKTSQKLIWDGGDLILPNFWRFITYQDHFPSLLCTITCLILHHIYCSITSEEYVRCTNL